MEDLYTWDITDQGRLLTQQNWKGFRIQRGIYKWFIWKHKHTNTYVSSSRTYQYQSGPATWLLAEDSRPGERTSPALSFLQLSHSGKLWAKLCKPQTFLTSAQRLSDTCPLIDFFQYWSWSWSWSLTKTRSSWLWNCVLGGTEPVWGGTSC